MKNKILLPENPALKASGFICLDRAVAPPVANEKRWCQVAVVREKPTLLKAPGGGIERGVVCNDRAAFEAMAHYMALDKSADGFRGLDVGVDHQRHSLGGTTERYGVVWDARHVAADDPVNDTLEALIEFNPEGAAMLCCEPPKYSFLTIEADLCECSDKKMRPYRLTAIDLTNNPNLPIQALNRADPASATASLAGGQETKPAKAATKGNSEMDKYRLMTIDCLKLNATATDEEIDAAFAKKFGPDEEEKVEGGEADAETEKKTKKAMNRVIVLQAAAIKDLNDEKLGKEADLFIEKNKGAIKALNRADVRAAYIANPEQTKKLFGALETKPVVTALNREIAQTPADRDTKDKDVSKTLKAELREKLIDETKKNFRCLNRTDAIDIARGQRPDLF